MAYKYKVHKGFDFQSNIPIKIEKVEIEKETEGTVLIDGGWRYKNSRFYRYFDTWKEANSYIIKNIKSELKREMKAINQIRKNLKIVRSLKEE